MMWRSGEEMSTKQICSVASCDKPHESKGFCHGHYERFRKGRRSKKLTAPLRRRNPAPPELCTVPNCIKGHSVGNLCRRHYGLFTKYGLSVQQMEIIDKGKATCEICGKASIALNRPLCVDHCHSSGIVRGLLCTNCNLALGYLHEDRSIIHSMLAYLDKHEIKTASDPR